MTTTQRTRAKTKRRTISIPWGKRQPFQASPPVISSSFSNLNGFIVNVVKNKNQKEQEEQQHTEIISNARASNANNKKTAMTNQSQQQQQAVSNLQTNATTIQASDTQKESNQSGRGFTHESDAVFIATPKAKTPYQYDAFDTYLNWATHENPDGIPLVHKPINQGHCGSCWALAATGSLEASVARKAASEAYEEYMASSGTSDQRTTTTRENDSVDFSSFFNAGFARKTLRYQQQQQQTEAVAQAQQVELETFQNLNLSIQELLDCDTTVDRGCIGGNPLLAFPFIHQYGLVDWREYPYIGARTPTARAGSPSSTTTTTTPGGGLWSAARTGSLSSCQFNRSQPAVATSHSWGRIPPNHEPSMEWALRYIGPIAVGIHGEAPSFLSYQGGVYSDVQCNTTALNHALLVVGYGQETVVLRHRHKHQIDPIISASTTNNKNKKKTSHTKIVKYWIARNSWGTGWGEGGFVRIQRRGESMDGYTTAGVCGIARNPSVALGGKLLVPLSSLTSSFSPLLNLSEHEDDGRVDSSKALHTLVPLNSYRSGEAGPYPSCNHILEPQNQEGDYSSLWDRALTTLAFSSCRFHELMAQHPGFWFMCVILCSCAIVVALVVWPLTFDCRQRRQRRLRQRQRRLEEQQLQHDSEERKQEQFSELEEKEKNGRDSGEPPAQSFVSLSSSITSHERGGDGVVNEETPLLQPRH